MSDTLDPYEGDILCTLSETKEGAAGRIVQIRDAFRHPIFEIVENTEEGIVEIVADTHRLCTFVVYESGATDIAVHPLQVEKGSADGPEHISVSADLLLAEKLAHSIARQMCEKK